MIVRLGIRPYYPIMWGVFYPLGVTMDEDRCPYCFEGKLMTSIERYLICDQCAHMVIPGQASFLCSCSKCRKLRRQSSFEIAGD